MDSITGKRLIATLICLEGLTRASQDHSTQSPAVIRRLVNDILYRKMEK